MLLYARLMLPLLTILGVIDNIQEKTIKVTGVDKATAHQELSVISSVLALHPSVTQNIFHHKIN